MVKQISFYIYEQQRKTSLLFIFLLFISLLRAQQISLPKWELQFIAPVYQKANLEFDSGSAKLNSATAIGYELAISKRWIFKEHTSLFIQLGIGRMAYRLKYEYLQEDYPELPFSIFQTNYTDRFYGLRRLSAGYEYAFPLHEKLTGSVMVCLGVRQIPSARSAHGASLTRPDGTFMRVLEVEMRSINQTLSQDLELKFIGYYKLSNRFLISGTVFGRFSFQNQVVGSFSIFPETVSRTSGSFEMSGSCLGFSLGFGLL
ncbi:MAG: hypothetical protein ACRC3B_04300 [Bacteroidia bacterium]